jgi:hypothetical protein
LTAPAPDVRHTGNDDEGGLFEVTRFVMRAGHNGLDYTMPVEDQ